MYSSSADASIDGCAPDSAIGNRSQRAVSRFVIGPGRQSGGDGHLSVRPAARDGSAGGERRSDPACDGVDRLRGRTGSLQVTVRATLPQNTRGGCWRRMWPIRVLASRALAGLPGWKVRRMSWVESGRAWGERAADWAYLVEPYARRVNDALFDRAQVGPGTRLLDIACGSGYAASVAAGRGAQVCGLDAS